MHDGQKDGALDIDIESPARQLALQDGLNPALLPEAIEDQPRADGRRRGRDRVALRMRIQNDQLLREARLA